jgi:hypothetical protein
MIKFMQCIRRKPQLSVAEFRQHWERYKGVWLELAKLSGAKRMVTSIGLDIDQNTTIQLARGTHEPFDGVLELWWVSGEQVAKSLQDPTLKEKLASMHQYQEEFVDLASSSFFFASEDELLGGS